MNTLNTWLHYFHNKVPQHVDFTKVILNPDMHQRNTLGDIFTGN